jgi:hypothetical protein
MFMGSSVKLIWAELYKHCLYDWNYGGDWTYHPHKQGISKHTHTSILKAWGLLLLTRLRKAALLLLPLSPCTAHTHTHLSRHSCVVWILPSYAAYIYLLRCIFAVWTPSPYAAHTYSTRYNCVGSVIMHGTHAHTHTSLLRHSSVACDRSKCSAVACAPNLLALKMICLWPTTHRDTNQWP